MAAPLSPYRLSKAREVYNYFNVFNAISWNLLVGIIITLFALRLGASPTYIGLMSATFYSALFFLPVGKMLARRFSIISIFSFTWIGRSLCMIFAIAAPFLDYAGHRNTALFLLMLGLLSFHLIRGIGMIGNNPVLSLMASGPDRGSYVTQIQIVNSAIGMFGSFIVAMVLGMEPPIFIFSILLGLGVISGVISGIVIKKIPEPQREEEKQGVKLRDIFKEAFAQNDLRYFLIILFFVILVSGVARTFIVVYAREVFQHNDGLISLYSVFGSLGFLMAGMSVKFLVDRLGAKPLFLVCVIIGLISLVPVIFFPASAVENVTGTILFMVFLFFMMHFGFLGSEGIAQTYFLALVPQEKILDMSMLYFFVFGAAGAGGSFLSGLLVDFFLLLGFSPLLSFRILFIILIVFVVIALSLQKKMKSLGSLPLSGALEVIFSVRDLRAISLLDKLNKAQDSKEEEILLGALHAAPSNLATDGLLERARSPKLATRQEAIRALEKVQKLNKEAEKALIEDAVNNPFTTAYISARILGNKNCTSAIPTLRELVFSQDYMLAGEAMIALAKLKDESFRTEIENIILDSQNPRLKITGAEALGLFHNAESIPALLDILHGKDQPPYLRDEVILAISSILDTQKKFYKLFIRYAKNNSLAATLAMDETEAAYEFVKTTINKKKIPKDKFTVIDSCAKNFHNVVSVYVKSGKGDEFSAWILELPGEYSRGSILIKTFFSEAVVDDNLSVHDCLRLLIIHWAAQELRIWAAMVK